MLAGALLELDSIHSLVVHGEPVGQPGSLLVRSLLQVRELIQGSDGRVDDGESAAIAEEDAGGAVPEGGRGQLTVVPEDDGNRA